jgi:hypothetical protein
MRKFLIVVVAQAVLLAGVTATTMIKLTWSISVAILARQVDLALNAKEIVIRIPIAQEIFCVSKEMVRKMFLLVVVVQEELRDGIIATMMGKPPWLTMVDARGAALAVNVKEIVILMMIVQETSSVSKDLAMRKFRIVARVQELLLAGIIATMTLLIPWLTMEDARKDHLVENVKEIVILMKNVMGILCVSIDPGMRKFLIVVVAQAVLLAGVTATMMIKLTWSISVAILARQVDLALNAKEIVIRILIAREIFFVTKEKGRKIFLVVVVVQEELRDGITASMMGKLPWLMLDYAGKEDLATHVKEVVCLMKIVQGLLGVSIELERRKFLVVVVVQELCLDGVIATTLAFC